MKYLLTLAAALSLAACATSPDKMNTVTISTPSDKVQLEDTAVPSTARDAIEDAKTN